MGLSRTVSEINGDFCRQSQIFPTSRVFCVPDEGVPKKLNDGVTGPSKKFDDNFSRVDTIH